MREARTNRALIIHMGANGHQSLQAQSAHRTDALGQVDGVLGAQPDFDSSPDSFTSSNTRP